MRLIQACFSALFSLYGFGERTPRRHAGPIRIGYDLSERRFG